eukprot:CAMPEP_0198299250 /NCGR_PEP_ID=MMETSP1449-20131203/44011_1 /TAXON_ID=420275 /ORGANISM="Attheya septentrionalis, Strain CCMP2084" /LENGTH=65 /DNA_ID=CAMNT_0044000739 /DNA_START=109 /DNA_END=303 /DNA_ORIENTATION=-
MMNLNPSRISQHRRRRLGLCVPVVAFIFCFGMSGTGSSLAEATSIKWTPGQTDGGAAAAAPKSQK